MVRNEILQAMENLNIRFKNCIENEGHRLSDVIFKTNQRHIYLIV